MSGESSKSSAREPEQAAAEHVNGVVRQVEREAATAQDPHHGVVLPQHRGARGDPRLDDAGRPRMEKEHAARAEDRLAQLRLPATARVGGRELAHDDLDHAVQQVVLAAHVGVERHRLDAELLAEPAHADRFDPVPIRQLDGSLEHALSRQRLAPLRVLDLHSQIAP